jgi:DNA invertase Pin-like site-specific DNA recombinase
MTGKRIGYIRVSSIDQNPERQLQGIQLDKVFIEHASGSSIKRPQLDAMINYVRDDDIIYVHSLDRLARNLKDLRNIIENFTSHNIRISFLNEGLEFNGDDTPISKLLLNIMGAVAEFELAIIRERMLEGVAIAKAKGKYKGRERSLKTADIEILKGLLQTRKTITQISIELKISRFTLYKYIREFKLPYEIKSIPRIVPKRKGVVNE